MDLYRLVIVFIIAQITDVIGSPILRSLTGNESLRSGLDGHHHLQKPSDSGVSTASLSKKRRTRQLDYGNPANIQVLRTFFEWLDANGSGTVQSRFGRSTRGKRSVPKQKTPRHKIYKDHEDAFLRMIRRKHGKKIITLGKAIRRLFKQIYFKNRQAGKVWFRFR